MSRGKALSFALVFALALQNLMLPFTVTASAADQDGLQTTGGKTYYYDNGKMVKNKWVTVKGDTYYFGSNGQAYKGSKKIGKYRYYFDAGCRMVSDKVVKINGKKYYFMNNGRAPKRAAMVNGKIWKTDASGRLLKNINSLAKEGKDFKAFRKAAGKQFKKDTMPSCLGPGKDVNYLYDNFTISTYEYGGSQRIQAVIEMTE